MLARFAIALAIAASALAGSVLPRSPARVCGTSITEDSLVSAESHFVANKVISNSTASKKAAVPVYLLQQTSPRVLIETCRNRCTGMSSPKTAQHRVEISPLARSLLR